MVMLCAFRLHSGVPYRSPGAWKDIYGHRKHGVNSFIKDPEFYNPSPNGGHILTAGDADHARQRRRLSHAISEKNVERTGVAPARSTVDMMKWYNYTTFDIFGDMAFGELLNCLRDNRYQPWVVMITPKKAAEMRNEHWRMSKDKVGHRLDLQATRPDFVSYILRHNDERGMTRQEIEENAGVLILAGSETTATLLSGCPFYVLKHPEKYNKLVQEIRGAFQKQDDITFLSNIFQERSRWGAASIDGQYVPEGISVSVVPFLASRAKSNFVEPESFIPERWLENRYPRFETDHREASQPFSFGLRNLLGKNLAYAEMRLIVAKLLWNFDMTLYEGCRDWGDQTSYIIW
ncbi:hypothetical protein KXW32_002774 [Aspergillus fumigatus]|nr:hypothetical protein KXW32_002774 [Aspergillus fumigatus]